MGEWMRRYKIPAYDETTGKGLVRHVYVRVNRKGESLCCVVVKRQSRPPGSRSWRPYVRAAVPHDRGRAGEQQHQPGQCDPGGEATAPSGGRIF